ncbi:MAG: class I SAM-dependent methyltransferase [Desulfovibrionaceae bacterium]|nr:class I SAM-dependent methyltransferase [Desulfovibrionaceae bacterium]
MKKPLNEMYDELVRNCAPDDFWGQVKRTVGGKPVSEEQIEMIVAAVVEATDLKPEDCMLDLCCGNGALSTRVFSHCAQGHGVDFSEQLINVAREHFEDAPRETYQLSDVVEFLRAFPDPKRFTKAFCYGSFQYLPQAMAKAFLAELKQRFVSVSRVCIGNLPDKERMNDFFREGAYVDGIEDQYDSAIGIWRTRQEFFELAAAAGWHTEFRTLPESYHASHYRYDAVLSRGRYVP